MAALTASTRYVPTGVRKIYWCPAISNPASPTRTELTTNGTDLTGEIAEMSGFTVSSDTVDVPDLSNRFVGKLPGAINADDSSIRFYASSNSTDVRAVLPRDTAGFIVCLWEGDSAGRKMDVFPVKVASASMQTAIDEAASIEVAFSVTSVPTLNVTVPA
jgi:hypothetical protein